jgi:hypothetical protein
MEIVMIKNKRVENELLEEIADKYVKSEKKLTYKDLHELYRGKIGYNKIADYAKAHNLVKRRKEFWERKALIEKGQKITDLKIKNKNDLEFVIDIIHHMKKNMDKKGVTPSYSELEKFIKLKERLMEKSKVKDEVIILGASRIADEDEVYPDLYSGVEKIENNPEEAELVKE